MNIKKITTIILIIVFIVFLDLITKYLISNNFRLYESIKIIEGFFYLTYTHNTGAGFSILEGQMLFFYLVTIVVSSIIIKMLVKEKDYKLIIAYSMILAGTFGNFYDRLRFSYVIDFLHFKFGTYHFPIFNIADIAISLGAILMLIVFILRKD